MVHPLMIFLALVYGAAVFAVIRRTAHRMLGQAEEELSRARHDYQEWSDKRDRILSEKKRLERQAAEIFTLYTMTKEITKNFSEEDALGVLKQHLEDYVSFGECRLLDPLSEEIKALKSSGRGELYELKGEKRLLGYLWIQDISGEGRDKVAVLVNQFALALRRIRLYQQIERLALTDGLTEAHTRRYILERFEEELRRSSLRASPVSFLMIDVDYFKRINDEHGHLTGDQVLRAIASLIKENIREIDLVGRYGGEEFCVILPDTSRDGAHFVAERIRSAVASKTILVYDAAVKVTLSIGIAASPEDGKWSQELVDKADWALYRAKKLGRNRICTFGVYDSDTR
ncbi:MAG: GGDEF domain-containing protein [Candidatus Omnitrophota bacterium]|nr:GGDEF domain-containing protein [Candidatus Omnitrophota bacterium]MDZ4242610.1 GGDEF domain-containing protein [Candidatus Omnitrophota bacterium]